MENNRYTPTADLRGLRQLPEMEKPHPILDDAQDGGEYYENKVTKYKEHLASLPIYKFSPRCMLNESHRDKVFELGKDFKLQWQMRYGDMWIDTKEPPPSLKDDERYYRAIAVPILTDESVFVSDALSLRSIPAEPEKKFNTTITYHPVNFVPAEPAKAEAGEGIEFMKYVKEARTDFCTVIHNMPEFNVKLRTAVDSLLICFDQMAERLQSAPGYPAEFVEWMYCTKWRFDHINKKWWKRYGKGKLSIRQTTSDLYKEYLKQSQKTKE